VWSCHGDRLAPLAAAAILHEQLVTERRRVEFFEILRLFPQQMPLDTPALILDRVADIRNPQRPVWAIAGRREIVLGAGCDDRCGRRYAAQHGAPEAD